jgi:peptide/nickel transport system permease protein
MTGGMPASASHPATRPTPRTGEVSRVVRFVAGKIGSLLLTLFLASLLIFFSRFLVPGDPARFLLGGRRPNPGALAALTKEFGLNLPPWQQYVNWLFGVLHGDLGISLQYREAVSTVIASRMPATLLLVAMSTVIIAVLGIAAGIVATVNRGKPLDRLTLIGLTVLSALPSFVSAIVLLAVFAVDLGWFPTFGSGQGFLDMVYHLTLPSIAMAVVFIVVLGKVTRSSMVEQLGREHVEVATSRGLTRGTVIRRHVFRNSLIPVLTVTGPLVAGLLVASTIVDSTFGLSGLGSLLLSSVDRLDWPVVEAITLFVVAAFLVVNTVVDLLAPLLDRRAAAGGGAR